MSAGATPESNRYQAAKDRGTSNTEARLRELVELYRKAGDGKSPDDDSDLRELVEEDQARRLLAGWTDHVACLRAEISAVNAALDESGIRLEPNAMEPGPGVSYLACLEIGIGGDRPGPGPSAFVALTRRAEARLQIRMPGCVRHETQYVALAEIGGKIWREWLLDLLEANRAWQRRAR